MLPLCSNVLSLHTPSFDNEGVLFEVEPVKSCISIPSVFFVINWRWKQWQGKNVLRNSSGNAVAEGCKEFPIVAWLAFQSLNQKQMPGVVVTRMSSRASSGFLCFTATANCPNSNVALRVPCLMHHSLRHRSTDATWHRACNEKLQYDRQQPRMTIKMHAWRCPLLFTNAPCRIRDDSNKPFLGDQT